MTRQFSFQQALFGYDAGHNLLASSIALPSEIKHTLSVTTDLSGSPPNDGFDQTFTGFPIVGSDFYALFCTWLAPEMPRPGCVWSQVLLIQLADFAELTDMGGLRKLFKRPNSSNFEAYELPLKYSPKIAPKPQFEKRLATELLSSLYVSWEKSVVISSSATTTFEELVFAIWSQQWPRLRRNFRFSTGSFSDRGRRGAAFDLQITPRSHRRAWHVSDKSFVLDEDLDMGTQKPKAVPTWMSAAVNDLSNPDETNLRSFLIEFGPDFQEFRGCFAKLANAFVGIYNSPQLSLSGKLEWVSEVYPHASEAIRLKEQLLRAPKFSNSEENLNQVWAAITFLMGQLSPHAFSGISFDASQHATLLWQKKRTDVLVLLSQLMRRPISELGTRFAAAIANEVKPSELKWISENYPDLIQIFISYQPALAQNVATWLLPESIQWRITEVLNKLALNEQSWGEIMAAKFITATHVAVRESIEKAGVFAINAVTRWLEHNGADKYLPSQIWRDALAHPITIYLQSERSLTPDRLALCAWIISPKNITNVLNAGREDIQRLAKYSLNLLPEPLKLPTAFLTVTLGLRANGPEGVKLIRRGYFDVYKALATSTDTRLNFPWESWMLLSEELPQPGLFRDWDRCKRLRKAVRKWVVKYPQFNDLLQVNDTTSEDTEIAKKTLDYGSESEDFID
jgi:hypothetical protein